MMNKKIDWKVSCAAIVILGIIQVAAMHYGINGTFRMIIASMIALIVGIQLPQFKTNM